MEKIVVIISVIIVMIGLLGFIGIKIYEAGFDEGNKGMEKDFYVQDTGVYQASNDELIYKFEIPDNQ